MVIGDKTMITNSNNNIKPIPDMYIPRWGDLDTTMLAFLQEDGDTLQNMLNTKFKATSDTMKYAPLRFFRGFVTQKASLFNHDKDRKADSDLINFDSLDAQESYAEQYLHCLRRSAMIIKKVDNVIEFEALDATQYFHYVQDDRELWFIATAPGHTSIYTTEGETNIVLGAVNLPLSKAVESYDLDKAFDEQYQYNKQLKFYTEPTELPMFPFVEWSYHRTNKAMGNELVSLEQVRITSLSWGIYNADPKLLMNIVLKTGSPNEEIKKVVKTFGRTTRVTKLGIGDDLSIFDTGDIKVLVDLQKTYNEMIVQQAVAWGVDKNAIVPSDKVESGEAKKVSLNYINDARKEHIGSAQAFDRAIFNVLKEVYNIDTNYQGISFRDLKLVIDKDTELNYAIKMRDEGFFTPEEAYAYVRKVTQEEAEERVQETEGITTQLGESYED